MAPSLHAVIEYHSPLAGFWQALADGEFDMAAGRDVIYALAGNGGYDPLVWPRGLPTGGFSVTVLQLFFYAVLEEGEKRLSPRCPWTISRAEAEKYIAHGHSRYYPFTRWGSHDLINAPDWHTPAG